MMPNAPGSNSALGMMRNAQSRGTRNFYPTRSANLNPTSNPVSGTYPNSARGFNPGRGQFPGASALDRKFYGSVALDGPGSGFTRTAPVDPTRAGNDPGSVDAQRSINYERAMNDPRIATNSLARQFVQRLGAMPTADANRALQFVNLIAQLRGTLPRRPLPTRADKLASSQRARLANAQTRARARMGVQ